MNNIQAKFQYHYLKTLSSHIFFVLSFVNIGSIKLFAQNNQRKSHFKVLFLFSGDAHFPHLPNMPQLFPSDGKVVEILDGSMERFRDKLVLNGVSAVLFYAPWCGQSLYAAHEFNTAAKMLHKEVVDNFKEQ